MEQELVAGETNGKLWTKNYLAHPRARGTFDAAMRA